VRQVGEPPLTARLPRHGIPGDQTDWRPMFRFKLQRVLDLRRQLRERLEAELSSLRDRLASERGALEQAMRERRGHVEAFRKRQSFSIEEFQLFHTFTDYLADGIRARENRIHALEEELENKIDEFMEARKREEIMVRLHEKEWHRFRNEISRRENAFFNEIAVRRYLDEQEGR